MKAIVEQYNHGKKSFSYNHKKKKKKFRQEEMKKMQFLYKYMQKKLQ